MTANLSPARVTGGDGAGLPAFLFRSHLAAE
jgi:hypothetical protein